MRIAAVLGVTFLAGLVGGLPSIIVASAAFGWFVRELEQAIRDALEDHPFPPRRP